MTITLQPQNFTIKALAGLLQSQYPNGAIPGPWQLPDGHYEPAVMDPVIMHPRPDSETHAWERHRMAPEGVAFSLPIVVQGGSRPHEAALTQAPPGMTVGQHYGDSNYHVIVWDSPTIGDHTVTVRVRTQEHGRNTSGLPDEVSVTFTLSIFDKNDTSKFIWLDRVNGKTAAAGGTGTFTNPFKFINDWWRSSETDNTFVGRQVFYRAGTYPFTNGPETSPGVFDMTNNSGNLRCSPAYKPMVHIGYPGEVAIWDFSNPANATTGLNYAGRWLGSAACSGLFIGNIKCQNGRQDVTNSHFFWLTGRTNEQRVTLFNCYFLNLQKGTSGIDNTSVMFGSTASGDQRYYSFFGNTYDGMGSASNGVSLYDLYLTDLVVMEHCVIKNCNSKYAAWHKSANTRSTFAFNVAVENVTTGEGLWRINNNTVEPNGYHEACFNIIAHALDGWSIGTNQDKDATTWYPLWFYRNTIVGQVRLTAGWAAVATDKRNVWITGNSQANQYQFNPAAVSLENVVAKRADGIVDGSYRLTDAYCAANGIVRGTRGHEVI